jgi:hypothetical protein
MAFFIVTDVKSSTLKHVFDKFPKYHTKIFLGDFNAKIGREDISKLTIGNESLLIMIIELE